jgi:hypothetical protein
MKYRLPEALGGGELESMASGSVRYPNLIGFCTEGEWFWVAKGLLTEVKELPEEPPVGSFVLVDATVLQRKDSAGIDWWDYGQQTWRTWVQLCDLALPDVPVLLVPDPFAEPVELPYVSTSVMVQRTEPDGTFVFLGLSTDGHSNEFEFQHLTNEQARGIARALWAAAAAGDLS